MKRKELLPVWIRFFAWIFLLFAMTPLFFVVGLFIPGDYNLTVFGLNYSGRTTMHPAAFYISGILTLAATLAYAILWGKKWAITLGIVYSLISLATIAYVVWEALSQSSVYIPLEPILLIPFLVILIKKKKQWYAFDSDSIDENDTFETEVVNDETTLRRD